MLFTTEAVQVAAEVIQIAIPAVQTVPAVAQEAVQEAATDNFWRTRF